MKHLAGSSLAFCSALALLVTACGDDGGSDPPDAQVPDAPPTPDVDAAPPLPPVVFVLSSDAVTINEGDPAGTAVTVKLGEAPGRTVTVAVASSDAGAAAVTPAEITFDDNNYDAEQTFTITSVDDPDGNDEAVVVTLSAEGASDGTVNVTVDDDDVQSLVVEPTALTVTEGDTATFTVGLTVQPNENLTVTIASSDAGAATATASLTFTPDNYDDPQTVTVTGVNDGDGNNEDVTLTVSSEGLTTGVPVAVSVVDDDSLNIVADPTTLTVTEGDTETFTVSLTIQPNNDVTVNVASDDTGAATVSTASLTFTPDNYDQPQTVTVTAVGDEDVADESVTVTLSGDQLSPVDVAVTVDDDDIQTVQASTTSVALNEGGSTTFTVRLSNDPLGSVTVALTSGDANAVSVSPATLTFNSGNYDDPQTVTVTAVVDTDFSDESVNVTAAAEGATTATVAVSVTDVTPYTTAMFVRISSTTPAEDHELVYQGDGIYEVVLSRPMEFLNFQISDTGTPAVNRFAIQDINGGTFITVGTPTPLVRTARANAQILLIIGAPTTYRFTLDANSPNTPVLTITTVTQ